MAKFSNGSFVFYRTRSSLQPMLPTQIEGIALQYGIPETIVPAYAGDRATIARAISQVTSKVSKQGWVLTRITTEGKRVVYGISQKDVDQERETVDFTYEANVLWDLAQDQGDKVHGDHDVAMQVNLAYQDLRGKIVASDWTESLTSYLTGTCQATPMREDGRVYWVPPTTQDKLNILAKFLAEVGIDVCICEIEPENRVVVQAAVQDNMASQIQALQDEVAEFDGTQRQRTYRERLTQYQGLRKRAIMYRDVLGIGVRDLEDALSELERKVADLMQVRQGTTIHPDGSTTVVDMSLETASFGEAEEAAF
jgi:hypothetical protein